MGIEEKTENGGNANVGLAPLIQIDNEFNCVVHGSLRSILGDDTMFDVWFALPGVSFGRVAGLLGKSEGVVYVPSEFFSGWLGDPKKSYRASIDMAFKGQGLETWKLVVDQNLCEQAKGVIPPVQANLEGVPEESDEDSKGLRLKGKRSREDFKPGEPPSGHFDFEDFVVGDSIVNRLALEATQEVAKPNRARPLFKSLVLCGPEESGKRMLLYVSLQAMLKVDPKLDIFCVTGKTFQSLYSSFFSTGESGGTNVDRRRLGIFEKCLLSAKVLVITDIDGTSSGAKGTRRKMAEAIRLTRERGKRGGRVLISLSRPPTEEDLGPELYRELKDLQIFRVEKIGASSYPEVAKRFLAKYPPRLVTAEGNKGGDTLNPKVIDWLIKKTKEGELSLLLSRLGTISFSQGCGVNGHRVTLAEAQELFKLLPDADDLISLIFERDAELRKETRLITPQPVLDLACYLASLVLGLEREVVAGWFYPGALRALDMTAGGIMRVKGLLEESAEARLQLSGLIRELLLRFTVPESKKKLWARQLEDWRPATKKRCRERC